MKCTLANWTEAIIFTTSSNSFGPTEISYLENRFCNLAMQANRYTIKNVNDPTPGNITDEKEKYYKRMFSFIALPMLPLSLSVVM